MNWTAKPFKALAIALMFWCAGAGCMIVSYARTMEGTDSSGREAEQPVAGMHASMDAHACCKAKHKSSKRTKLAARSIDPRFKEVAVPSPVRTNAMSCCPLTTGSIVVASRSQTGDSASELPLKHSSSFNLENSDPSPLAIPLRLPNRAHSYLLDCAFLI